MDLLMTLKLPFIACLLMTAIMGYLGIHVLKREVIFIDIAMAQVAALGAIIAHMCFHAQADSFWGSALAFGATLIASLFFAIIRRRVSILPIEVTIGITYAIVAAGALFLIGKSTCGHVHTQKMLTGSLLWVLPKDILWAVVIFAIAGVCFVMLHRPLRSISDDYEGAVESGISVVFWDFLFYSLCGVVITVAVRLAGVVVVFCFLIIPATVSALLASGWRARLVVAWLVGVAASVLGLLFSRLCDFSAGVSVALFQGLLLVMSSAVVLVRRRLLNGLDQKCEN